MQYCSIPKNSDRLNIPIKVQKIGSQTKYSWKQNRDPISGSDLVPKSDRWIINIG